MSRSCSRRAARLGSDVVVVVTAASGGSEGPGDVPTVAMTEAAMHNLLQAPVARTVKSGGRAHFIIDTGSGIAAAERQVDAVLRALSAAS
jgi:phosphoribosylamine-glycine ligase